MGAHVPPPAPAPGTAGAAQIPGAAANANALSITIDGRRYVFAPGQVVRIGRAPDNDIVVGHSAVSRWHAQLTWVSGGPWMFQNVGQAPTFSRGQAVTQLAVTEPLDLALGSVSGPFLHIETAAAGHAAPGPQAGYGSPWQPRAPVGPGASGRPGAPGYGPPGFGEESALRILIPIQSWLHNPGWRQGLRLLVITYALLPLLFIALFAASGSLFAPGAAYSIYIAPLWGIGFWWLIRPGPIRKLEIQIGIAIIVFVLIWINVVTVNINDAVASPDGGLSLVGALVVGFNEEISKALPVFLAGIILLYARKTKLDPRMWMFFGTIAGLTFGVFESIFYTSQAIGSIHGAQVASQAVSAVLAFAERIFVDGFQHAIWAGISCFFIGMGINYHRRRIPLIALGVAIPALLHALNDWSLGFFNSYWPWILIQAFSLFLFLGYTMSAAAIEQKVRATPLFRGESLIMEAFWSPRRPAPGPAAPGYAPGAPGGSGYPMPGAPAPGYPPSAGPWPG